MDDRQALSDVAASGTDQVGGRTGVWLEGLRAAAFLPPRWRGRGVSAWVLVLLAVLVVGLNLAVDRLAIGGPAAFQLPALGTGWAHLLFGIAACGLVARRRAADESAPDTVTLVAWMLVVDLLLSVVIASIELALVRRVARVPEEYLYLAAWALFTVHLAWFVAATATMLCRQVAGAVDRVGVVGLLALQAASVVLMPAQPLWLPKVEPLHSEIHLPAALSASGVPAGPSEEDLAAEGRDVFLTQERLEAQSRAVVDALDGVLPQRPGVTELYAITFAPYADEDVFSRETAMIGGVMRDRFDAAGRQLNLQNHASTVATVPWATPLNLERAIHRMALRMDPAEDILFLHLTSHGGRDGRLAAGFEPVFVPPVTPKQLRRWLDDAGVRYAVISISACFSGSWIKPLAAPGTLVMTAADATHTSYGCGRRSPLTFFGRAMYDEELRKVRSFEAAFAAALPVIDRREKEAGKSDGPSNPQILVGAAVRPKLAALVARLEAAAPSPVASAPAVGASGPPVPTIGSFVGTP